MAWSIAGKTVVVTGATNGIGLAAAEGLARLGAHLVLVGRDRTRGEAALASIRAKGDTNAQLFLADLSLTSEVRRLGAELNAALPRIDVLLNNAGAVFTEKKLTSEGFERTFALNHLGYFLLTELLLPKLQASAPARIISVASEAHRQGKLDFDNLQAEKSFSAFGTYGMSKLANILFTRELARRVAGTGVTAFAMHPGVVATGFGQNTSGIFKFGLSLIRPFFRKPEKGASTAVFLATDPDVDKASGKYFADRKEKQPTSAAQSDADAKRLWEVSEQLVAQKKAAA